VIYQFNREFNTDYDFITQNIKNLIYHEIMLFYTYFIYKM
jgi:hypothetical protein